MKIWQRLDRPSSLGGGGLLTVAILGMLLWIGMGFVLGGLLTAFAFAVGIIAIVFVTFVLSFFLAFAIVERASALLKRG